MPWSIRWRRSPDRRPEVVTVRHRSTASNCSARLARDRDVRRALHHHQRLRWNTADHRMPFDDILLSVGCSSRWRCHEREVFRQCRVSAQRMPRTNRASSSGWGRDWRGQRHLSDKSVTKQVGQHYWRPLLAVLIELIKYNANETDHPPLQQHYKRVTSLSLWQSLITLFFINIITNINILINSIWTSFLNTQFNSVQSIIFRLAWVKRHH